MTMLIRKLLVFELAVIAVTLGFVSSQEKKFYIPKCPPLPNPENEATTTTDSNSYCECLSAYVTASRATVSIKCDFNNTKDVMLTEDLYPFRNASLGSAYVRIVNASSVHVTRAFLTELMQSPSVALDVWQARTLILDKMPPLESNKFKNYRTFVGVGIVNCFVPEIPKYFMRDRTRGGLRIKSSHVGNFHGGVLHNLEEMRYLVFEDSRVDFFEGSVATEGFVTLSKRQLHAWTGLLISNVTIDTISSGTFNITHMSDMVTTKIVDSNIGNMNTGALIVTGDIDVTIQNNVFQRMETMAMQVDVTGDVIFDKNNIANWEPDALDGLICHKRTSVKENTFHVDDPMDIAMNISLTPFHTSCGNPQLFLVISPQHPLAIKVNTSSSWTLGAVLFLLVVTVVLVAVYSHKRQNMLMPFYRGKGPIPLGKRETKLSQQNLPNGAEIDPSTEVTEEGMSNPIYVDVNETS